jgi:hypothetical protein
MTSERTYRLGLFVYQVRTTDFHEDDRGHACSGFFICQNGDRIAFFDDSWNHDEAADALISAGLLASGDPF